MEESNKIPKEDKQVEDKSTTKGLFHFSTWRNVRIHSLAQKKKQKTWKPVCNVSETDLEYIIQCELPGIPKEHINLEIEDCVITIFGERLKKEVKGEKMYSASERKFGPFKEAIPLPDDIDEAKITAKCELGVLEVTVAKIKKPVTRIRIVGADEIKPAAMVLQD